jgi:hypothetical protein
MRADRNQAPLLPSVEIGPFAANDVAHLPNRAELKGFAARKRAGDSKAPGRLDRPGQPPIL